MAKSARDGRRLFSFSSSSSSTAAVACDAQRATASNGCRQRPLSSSEQPAARALRPLVGGKRALFFGARSVLPAAAQSLRPTFSSYFFSCLCRSFRVPQTARRQPSRWRPRAADRLMPSAISSRVKIAAAAAAFRLRARARARCRDKSPLPSIAQLVVAHRMTRSARSNSRRQSAARFILRAAPRESQICFPPISTNSSQKRRRIVFKRAYARERPPSQARSHRFRHRRRSTTNTKIMAATTTNTATATAATTTTTAAAAPSTTLDAKIRFHVGDSRAFCCRRHEQNFHHIGGGGDSCCCCDTMARSDRSPTRCCECRRNLR